MPAYAEEVTGQQMGAGRAKVGNVIVFVQSVSLLVGEIWGNP